MTAIDLQFCSACGKVCDTLGVPSKQADWMDLRDLQLKHGYRSGDLTFHQTFCPSCANFYRQVQGL